MLLLHRSAARRRGGRIGLAVAGGGPLGGTYELGALRALEEAVEGLDLTALDVYVGVSSGAFIAAGLANGITVEQMVRIYILGDPDEPRFRPEGFLRPAFAEFLRRSGRVPRILLDWLRELVRHPAGDGFGEIFGRLGTLVPVGLFDNEAIGAFLSELFSRPGRSDDFRRLRRLLYVVAVELDTGEIVRFGAPGHDDVPISRAVQASAALPGLYPPVEIKGRLLRGWRAPSHPPRLGGDGRGHRPADRTQSARALRRRARPPPQRGDRRPAPRRRAAGGALADLPHAPAIADAGRSRQVRPRLPPHRPHHLRGGSRRRRALLHERLQLPQPCPDVRARLPPHARRSRPPPRRARPGARPARPRAARGAARRSAAQPVRGHSPAPPCLDAGDRGAPARARRA
ncbi:MAG: patatin-like phospholipase family protein [Xanthomonadales bacterium]|nr:patatin-like phospholipase family protein [Xanthomonadales bacterium]